MWSIPCSTVPFFESSFFAFLLGTFWKGENSTIAGNSFPEINTEKIEPVHQFSENVVCATSKDSDQPAHTRSLIRAFASRLNIL